MLHLLILVICSASGWPLQRIPKHLGKRELRLGGIGQISLCLLIFKMVEAFLGVVLSNLNSIIREEIGLLWGINEEMQKLSSLFTTIKAVIEDAEENQLKDRPIRNWLQKLNIAAHEVDDILDDCATEASRVKHKGNYTMPCFYPPWNIWFSHRIGKRMKEITRRLNDIADERMEFHLNEFTGTRQVRADFTELRETSSILTQPEVFGRNEEREEIVDILLNQIKDVQKASVLPIHGVGGLGKTTLAQFVFNDERVSKHFDLKLWVCVSDDFNVKRITKAIVESAGEAASEARDLDPLQRKLQNLMRGKRYLLVLDDLWNDDPDKWEKLKCALDCGSSGSSIVTTTRMEKVARIVGTLPTYHLQVLSEEDCWLLFRQRAFGQEAEEHSNLVSIGKEIVKKCGGVPLAAKALGSFLRFKRDENEWILVKESELWNLPQDEVSILPALRLSYQNLSPELRQCFAYCSVYSKGWEIEKEEVIQLWMANGFIAPTGRLELEHVGEAVWNELYWRSFFQDAKKDRFGNVTTFKMHDLVHDLAESVMEGKYHATEIESSSNSSKSTIRHAALGLFVTDERLTVAFPRNAVRGTASHTELAQFGSLRTFEARQFPDFLTGQFLMGKEEVLSALGKMKHLRYLNLSLRDISMLPDSICQLWNLQTLKLDGCCDLSSLPENLRLLKNLRHMYIDDCSLTHIPSGIGQLTRLKTLTAFVVGEGRGSRISELQELRLGGMLSIRNLERVENPQESQGANLMAKVDLRELELSWEEQRPESNYNDEEVLETLKPPPNLLSLKIMNFKGTSFPNWFGVSTLRSLKVINCPNLTSLPVLLSLRHLEIYKCRNLVLSSISNIGGLTHLLVQGDEQLTSFPEEILSNLNDLEHLTIRNCPKLESLPVGIQSITSLQYLSIGLCPELAPRLEKEKGEDWHKIQHIPDVDIW